MLGDIWIPWIWNVSYAVRIEVAGVLVAKDGSVAVAMLVATEIVCCNCVSGSEDATAMTEGVGGTRLKYPFTRSKDVSSLDEISGEGCPVTDGRSSRTSI